jgi:putative ABC transport system permease protein
MFVMRWMHVLGHAVRSLLGRRALDRQIDEDIAFHLDEATAEYVRGGLPPDEARKAALKAFGNPVGVRDDVRDESMWAWAERLGHDLRYSLRGFRRTPVFAVAAVLSIALGIGASTALFSLFHALVLRPVPVRDPATLYQVLHTGDAGTFESSTYAFYEQVRSRSDLVAGALLVNPAHPQRVVIGGQADAAATQRVTGTYYALLGITPAIGRVIQPDDEHGAVPNRVAVLGHRYWMTRFGGDVRVLGRTIVVDDEPHTIVGVTGPEFFGLQVGRRADVTVPLDGQEEPTFWKSRALIVRLAPGVSRDAAATGLEAAFQQYLGEGERMPAERRAGAFRSSVLASSWSGLPEFRDRYGTAVQIALGIMAVLLVLGCANLASLFLARAAGRQHDLSVCLALGANRGRLARQVLSETLFVAVTGGVLGVVVAVGSVRMLLGLLAGTSPSFDLSIGPDRTVLLFGLAVTLLTGIAIGLAPVALTRHADVRQMLAGGGRSVAVGGRAFRVLVVVQVALSTLLVIAAMLLLATLENLRAQPLGFETDGVLTLTVDADGTGLEGEQLADIHARVLRGLQALPGVRLATAATNPPLGTKEDGKLIAIPGMTFASPDDAVVQVNTVAPDFFETFGVRILRGRGITVGDTASSTPVVVVSESMARHYFGAADPIGRRIDIGRGRTGGQIEIVGVAADVRYRDLRTAAPRMLYVAARQREPEETMLFAIRSSGDPAGWSQAVTDVVRAVEPSLLTTDVKTLARVRDERLINERLLALLSAGFGALALLLAAIGVYGVVAYSVSMRTSEFGLRAALGATRPSLLWLGLRTNLALLLIAIAVGSGAAVLVSSLVAEFLFQVQPAEPWIYATTAVLLLVVGLAAAVVPTFRAAGVDPAQTLRWS